MRGRKEDRQNGKWKMVYRISTMQPGNLIAIQPHKRLVYKWWRFWRITCYKVCSTWCMIMSQTLDFTYVEWPHERWPERQQDMLTAESRLSSPSFLLCIPSLSAALAWRPCHSDFGDAPLIFGVLLLPRTILRYMAHARYCIQDCAENQRDMHVQRKDVTPFAAGDVPSPSVSPPSWAPLLLFVTFRPCSTETRPWICPRRRAQRSNQYVGNVKPWSLPWEPYTYLYDRLNHIIDVRVPRNTFQCFPQYWELTLVVGQWNVMIPSWDPPVSTDLLCIKEDIPRPITFFSSLRQLFGGVSLMSDN